MAVFEYDIWRLIFGVRMGREILLPFIRYVILDARGNNETASLSL